MQLHFSPHCLLGDFFLRRKGILDLLGLVFMEHSEASIRGFFIHAQWSLEKKLTQIVLTGLALRR